MRNIWRFEAAGAWAELIRYERIRAHARAREYERNLWLVHVEESEIADLRGFAHYTDCGLDPASLDLSTTPTGSICGKRAWRRLAGHRERQGKISLIQTGLIKPAESAYEKPNAVHDECGSNWERAIPVPRRVGAGEGRGGGEGMGKSRYRRHAIAPTRVCTPTAAGKPTGCGTPHPWGAAGTTATFGPTTVSTAILLAVVPPVVCRCRVPGRSRSHCGAVSLSALLGGRPSECGFHPRRSGARRECARGVPDRVVSCSDRQMQRFALALVVNRAGLWREHERKRVDDVFPCFFARTALAERAGNLEHSGDNPAILVGRVKSDRQVQRVRHGLSVAQAAWCGDSTTAPGGEGGGWHRSTVRPPSKIGRRASGDSIPAWSAVKGDHGARSLSGVLVSRAPRRVGGLNSHCRGAHSFRFSTTTTPRKAHASVSHVTSRRPCRTASVSPGPFACVPSGGVVRLELPAGRVWAPARHTRESSRRC